MPSGWGVSRMFKFIHILRFSGEDCCMTNESHSSLTTFKVSFSLPVCRYCKMENTECLLVLSFYGTCTSTFFQRKSKKHSCLSASSFNIQRQSSHVELSLYLTGKINSRCITITVLLFSVLLS